MNGNRLRYPTTNYIVYDLETTGVDPHNCEITEIAIKVVSEKETFTKSFLMKTQNPIPEQASKITGITDDMLKKDGKKPFDVLAEIVSYFIKADAIVGHNIINYDNIILDRYLTTLIGVQGDGGAAFIIPINFRNCIDTGALFKAHALAGTLYQGEQYQWWNENHTKFARRIMDIRAAGVRWNLSTACEEMKIDTNDLTAHRAAADVEMVDRLYKRFITK